MGVKSTIHLSRNQAVSKAIELHMQLDNSVVTRYMLMSEEELEDELQHMNDAVKGGEGYENYTIED